MRGVQDGNTPVTQPLNNYGGLLEEAEPGPIARFLAWMRQPRNLLVVGISAVALLVAGGALAMMLPSNGSIPLATDTATPSVTQSTDPSQSPTSTPSTPATRTPVPKESMPPAPEPEQNSPETPIDPNQGGTGGSGSGESGDGYGGGYVAPCADGRELDANGTCVPIPTDTGGSTGGTDGGGGSTDGTGDTDGTDDTGGTGGSGGTGESGGTGGSGGSTDDPSTDPEQPVPGGGTGETPTDEGTVLGNDSNATGE